MSTLNGTWKKLIDLPFQIAEAASVGIKNSVIMFGGAIQEKDTNILEKADCLETHNREIRDSKNVTFKISRNIWNLSIDFVSNGRTLQCSRIRLPFMSMGSCAVLDNVSNFIFITGGRNLSR